MATSQDIVSISNRALLSIGSRSKIQSLDEGSTESDAISILFAPTFEALARTAYWGCLRSQATLSLLAAAAWTPENVDGATLPLPPTPWNYVYGYPNDCLDLRYIEPSYPANNGNTPQTSASIASPVMLTNGGKIPFAISNGVDSNGSPITVILTNQSQAQGVYTINQPNPSVWDSLFQQAMVASLAAYLVPALSLNISLMQMCIKTAETAIMQARVADGNEAVVTQDREASWITARTSGYGYLGMFGNNNVYTPMLWPSGW